MRGSRECGARSYPHTYSGQVKPTRKGGSRECGARSSPPIRQPAPGPSPPPRAVPARRRAGGGARGNARGRRFFTAGRGPPDVPPAAAAPRPPLSWRILRLPGAVPARARVYAPAAPRPPPSSPPGARPSILIPATGTRLTGTNSEIRPAIFMATDA